MASTNGNNSDLSSPPKEQEDIKQTTRHNKKKKKKREFNISKYHTRHIALKVAYIGWNYHGFASQKDTENTIEHHLFSAMQKTCLIQSREEGAEHYSRCGRTDKGVSAFGQVIALHLRSNLHQGLGIVESSDTTTNNKDNLTANDNEHNKNNNNEDNNNKTTTREKKTEEVQYITIMNRVLPPEIRVIAWAPVPLNFSARFSALYRTYKYFFVNDGMDIELMREGANHFLGEHDFRNFCKMDVENVTNYKRTMISIDISPTQSSPYLFCITVRGFAFLWHQIRCMVAILFLVGKHQEKPQVVADMLDLTVTPSKPSYEMASEVPLVLYDCGFEEVEWHEDEEGCKRLIENFGGMYHDLMLKSAVAELMLNGVKDLLKSTSTSTTREGAPYVPLLMRPRDSSLEERMAKQSEKKRKRDRVLE